MTQPEGFEHEDRSLVCKLTQMYYQFRLEDTGHNPHQIEGAF